MKPLIKLQKLGSINSEEWIQFYLKKCSEEQKAQKPFKPKECRIYLTPRDEEEIRHCELKEKQKKDAEEYKKKIAKMYEERDREYEERRQKYINKETDTY